MNSFCGRSKRCVWAHALSIVVLSACATGFIIPPAQHRSSVLGRVIVSNEVKGASLAARSPVIRSASSNAADGGSSSSVTAVKQSRAVGGWSILKRVKAEGAVHRVGASPLQRTKKQGQQKEDWSKLFATPVPEAAYGARILAGMGRRSRSVLVGESCGSFPIFFTMVMLVGCFAPQIAIRYMMVWGLGRVAYWYCMRGADTSQRLPVGLVAYMSLFFVVGGFAFMNGLKAVSLLNAVY